MSNYCGECRFFDGSYCSLRNCISKTCKSSACTTSFSAYGKDTIDEVVSCGECRFFTGSACSVKSGISKSSRSSACSNSKATCR